MQVTVLYFAITRERVGLASEPVELPEGARVDDLLGEIGRRHATLAPLLPALRVAVDERFAGPDTLLADGAEVALIPPVAGGGADERFCVLAEPLSVDRVIGAAGAGDRGGGGVVTFLGLVRDSSGGRAVERLEYEAYGTMAERVLHSIGDEVAERWPAARVAVHHRVGALVPGDLAVVIAAAAPHRVEAFAACRHVIERIKEDCPIWKREAGPDGVEWVGMGP